jgi:hypothetical protein
LRAVFISICYFWKILANEDWIGYYNTWTEEIFDEGNNDEDSTSTEMAATEESDSEISPGHDSSIDVGASSRGLDFMSSAGPQIEFGYDTASDEDYDDENSGDETDDASSLADIGQKRKTSPAKRNLVRRNQISVDDLFLILYPSSLHLLYNI